MGGQAKRGAALVNAVRVTKRSKTDPPEPTRKQTSLTQNAKFVNLMEDGHATRAANDAKVIAKNKVIKAAAASKERQKKVLPKKAVKKKKVQKSDSEGEDEEQEGEEQEGGQEEDGDAVEDQEQEAEEEVSEEKLSKKKRGTAARAHGATDEDVPASMMNARIN